VTAIAIGTDLKTASSFSSELASASSARLRFADIDTDRKPSRWPRHPGEETLFRQTT